MKKSSSQKCLKIPRAVTLGAVGLQPGDVFRHFYFRGESRMVAAAGQGQIESKPTRTEGITKPAGQGREAMRKLILPHLFLTASITLAFFFFMANLAFAKVVAFEKEYTYQASELDSKVSCRTISIEQVKRLLLEELGTYLESYTEVKDFQLTKDKLTALTAGIVQIQILDEKWDGKNYWLKAKVSADAEDIAKSIDVLRKDQKKAEELEDIKRKSDDALREVERLRNELKELKDDIKAKEKYDKSVETLEHPPRSKQVAVPAASVPEYKYVASKNSNKYHYPACKWALKINPKNLMIFKSAKEALGAGYVPCKICKPPTED